MLQVISQFHSKAHKSLKHSIKQVLEIPQECMQGPAEIMVCMCVYLSMCTEQVM